MLLIGSLAASWHGLTDRRAKDTDYICTLNQFKSWCGQFEKGFITRCVPLSDTKIHVRDKYGWNYEFEIADEVSNPTAWKLMEVEGALNYPMHASPVSLLALKLSHRYKRNSPHFLKTMRDIQHYRSLGIQLTEWHKGWLVEREKATYVYSHPKLNVTSKDFFNGDGVTYIFDHDSIHEAVALVNIQDCNWPAYKSYMKEGSEVMTSKQKFFDVSEETRINGVYEESCVLALERSQIPFNMMPSEPGSPVWFDRDRSGPSPRQSFEMALMKVCTSITSGWFREFAWENYDKVLDLYNELGEDDYMQRFIKNQHLLSPYTGENY